MRDRDRRRMLVVGRWPPRNVLSAVAQLTADGDHVIGSVDERILDEGVIMVDSALAAVIEQAAAELPTRFG